MTNPTPHGQVPEALRLAAELEREKWHVPAVVMQAAAEELRRLHVYCQELESQVIRDCMTHVQNPAEIEHVAGDVSKNGAELNTSQQPAPAAVVYSTPEEMFDAILTPQPAPATQQAGEVSESIEQLAVARYKVVPAHESMFHRWAVVAGDGAQQLYIGREVECENMTRKFAGAFLDGAFLALQNATPQPPPTTQAAESVPAIQGEMNVQLDTDSNHSAPGQQRDMACSLALGQPVGNGSDQVAGHPSAQGDKLLTVAERNIRSFLRSAQFKGESDREAALNCVDVLWAAARAPAGSVTAPAGGVVAYLDIGAGGYLDLGTDLADEALSRLPKGRHALVIAGTYGIDGYTAASTPQSAPPPQAAPAEVLEDAARWHWMAEYIVGTRTDLDDELIASATVDELRKLVDADLAARKQGANHD